MMDYEGNAAQEELGFCMECGCCLGSPPVGDEPDDDGYCSGFCERQQMYGGGDGEAE